MNQHYFILTGPYHQRAEIIRFMNTLLGLDSDPFSAYSKSLRRLVPYGVIHTDTQQFIHLFALPAQSQLESLLELMPTLKCLVLISSKTPESWREVKSFLETLHELHIPFLIVAHPANHSEAWAYNDMRQALHLQNDDKMLMTEIHSKENAVAILTEIF